MITERTKSVFVKIYEIYKLKFHGIFSELIEHGIDNLNSKQYEIFRNNYFYRTQNTIPSIVRLASSCIQNNDYQTLCIVSQNLFEETGSGNPDKSHRVLLEELFNYHGEFIYGLKPVKLIDFKELPHITMETKTFLGVQNKLYNSNFQFEVLATNYAQELAATDMLIKIKECIFEPKKDFYMRNKYEELMEYFYCHLDGLEQRHADDAKNALFMLLSNGNEISIATEAFKQILEAQLEMFNSLKLALIHIKNE